MDTSHDCATNGPSRDGARFAASPEEVQLDEGLSTEIEQAVPGPARRVASRSCRQAV